MFPEKLVELCLAAGTDKGNLVLDPFMGAGTTAVVAQRLGRRFLGLELIPGYADMARRRLAGAAGTTPLFEEAFDKTNKNRHVEEPRPDATMLF